MTAAPPKQLLLAALFLAGSITLLLAVMPEGNFLLGSVDDPVFDGGGLIEGLERTGEEIEDTGIREETDLILVIGEILKFILLFAGILVIIAIIVAGFLFILGFGSDASLQRGKKILIWAPVGLVLIILAFVLVDFVIDLATAA